VIDNIPSYTTYVPGTAADGIYDADLNQLSWTLENLEPYENVYLSFRVVIEDRTPAQTVITNVGTVSSPGRPDSDEATTTVMTSSEPRMYIEKQVDKLTAYPGDTLTYTLIIWNGGEGDAENIMVQDNIPEYTSYILGSAFDGTYDPNLNQLSWTIGNLESNTEAYLSFQVAINPGTPEQTAIINIGRVISPGPPDSDDAQTTVLAYPGPRLYIEKQVDKSLAFAGDTLNYTLIISNISATAAENVVIEDYIPDYLTYVSGSAFGGIYDSDENLLSWTISKLEWRYRPILVSVR